MSYHQRRSKRLKGYNYCSTGIYFVTIRTKGIDNILGRIENRKVFLNKHGLIAYDEWINTSHIRTNVQLDAFIIMPDHIHTILMFNSQEKHIKVKNKSSGKIVIARVVDGRSVAIDL